MMMLILQRYTFTFAAPLLVAICLVQSSRDASNRDTHIHI